MLNLRLDTKENTMRLYSFLAFSLLLALGNSCGSAADPAKLFAIQLEGNKKQFQNGQHIGIAIKNKKDKTINKVEYSIDGQDLVLTDGKIPLKVEKLGTKTLNATVYFDETTAEISKKIIILAEKSPEIYTYEILNEFPHDKNAFTQGLEFKGDTLYESTGIQGKSTLRKVNFKTGELYQKIDLKKNEFGEGLTLFDAKVIQLTWRNGLGYVYDQNNLEQTATFNYGASKEGWGLCNDGEKIYKSDGTEKIWMLDPTTLAEKDHIETVTNKSIFNKANELEFVDGKIYANVWQKESMMIIDASTGAIVGVINFGGLKSKVEQHDRLDVLNGVAYHKERGTFFVTGKNWSKLFEVRISKKE